jgi:predicted alpha/beta superfamily hydrolase
MHALASALLALALFLCGPARAAEAPVSSAQPNVSVLGPLAMPGLGRERLVRLYLPPSYATAPTRRYPVIYMHDGQNLFDAATAYAGEWGVDETLNELARSEGFEAIVVGIDNGGERRMNELSPYAHPRIRAAEGAQYLSFVVDVLKPLIDKRYRSLPGREHTAIMGSSMGGLISHFAIQRYPDVFSKAALFSPSYWLAPALFDEVAARALAPDARLYLYVGGREGDMVADARRMHTTLLRLNPPQALTLHVAPEAEHNEAAWRAEFGRALRWLFRPAGAGAKP